MTIFDKLRFSDIDIFQKSDLDKLPSGVVEIWINDITKDIKYPYTIDLTDPRTDISKIVYNTSFICASNQTYSNRDTRELLVLVYKKRFTNLLAKILADFENPA